MVKDVGWVEDEIDFLNKNHFLTAKPQVYLINIHKDDYLNKKENKWMPNIKEYLKDKIHDKMIDYSVEYEKELEELAGNNREDREAMEKEFGVKSRIDTIVRYGL